MRKILLICLVSVLAIALAGPALVSAQPDWGDKGLKGRIGQAGNSNNAFMELWEKTNFDLEVADGRWSIDTEGAWGKLKYDLSGSTFNFLFNGHGLEPGTDYTLIYYPDPWPGSGLISLGTATANEGGNIHISGSVDTGNLPSESDENIDEGAKIWLVLSDDVDVNDVNKEMAEWNPGEYLFEYGLITFTADVAGVEATASSDSNPGNPNKPDKPSKPDKPEKSNNGKGNNK